MIRRPPRSTLFPYTRSSDLLHGGLLALVGSHAGLVSRRHSALERHALDVAHRSEEHTSELQSQSNLVCRLLLEKKKMACLIVSTAAVTADATQLESTPHREH